METRKRSDADLKTEENRQGENRGKKVRKKERKKRDPEAPIELGGREDA